MGRTRRLATPDQRRALRAMYRTCGFPGCQVRFEDCRIHHVTWWEHLGTTNLDNLLPLCERHHHHVHEGGWPSRSFKASRAPCTATPTSTASNQARTTATAPPTQRAGRDQQVAASVAASPPTNATTPVVVHTFSLRTYVLKVKLCEEKFSATVGVAPVGIRAHRHQAELLEHPCGGQWCRSPSRRHRPP